MAPNYGLTESDNESSSTFLPFKALMDMVDPHSSKSQCMAILKQIALFEEGLDNDHEVAICLASFGQNITMSVVNIGYSNPDIMIFSGYVGNEKSTLIQHISQLNFLLTTMKKAEPAKPPHRIGFQLPNLD